MPCKRGKQGSIRRICVSLNSLRSDNPSASPAIRRKNGAFCSHCGSTRVYHFSDNRAHKCGDGKVFASQALLAVEADLDSLRQITAGAFAREIEIVSNQLAEQRRHLAIAYEADTFRSITEEARMLRQEISRLRHKPRARALEMEVAVRDLEQRRRRASGVLDEAAARELDGHLQTAQTALLEERFGVCERAIEAGDRVLTRVVVNQPVFFFMRFTMLQQQRHTAVDKARFDQLVSLGTAAMQAGNEQRVRQVLIDIHANMVDAGGQTGDATAQAGLRL